MECYQCLEHREGGTYSGPHWYCMKCFCLYIVGIPNMKDEQAHVSEPIPSSIKNVSMTAGMRTDQQERTAEPLQAHKILEQSAGHLKDRASTYDNPEGERSMPNAVAAFNAVSGHSLTPEQGWLFMALLKAVRTQQGGFRADNYEDGAAYFALAGEQAASDR